MVLEIIFLLVVSVLIIALYFQSMKRKYLESIAESIISISDTEYSFIIRRIRENTTSVSLYGIDNIEVRISKEDFVLHQVEVGKLWVYDGDKYSCIDPNIIHDVNKEFFK